MNINRVDWGLSADDRMLFQVRSRAGCALLPQRKDIMKFFGLVEVFFEVAKIEGGRLDCMVVHGYYSCSIC
jgi:hypothetical protein